MSGTADSGKIIRDTVTGRTVLMDSWNDPVLIGPRPGLDVVSPYGAQRIQALPTPAAPVVTPRTSGSTTWTYYVVAIDKDGNKTPPSPAGSTAVGASSLSSTDYNYVTWKPVDGAVKYDLLHGDTSHSVATNLVTTHYVDTGTSTSAYTASTTNPVGKLTVDDVVTIGGALSAASGSEKSLTVSPTVNQSGTASYVGVSVEATETGTGSGTKRLFQGLVGGTVKWFIDNGGGMSLAGHIKDAATSAVLIGFSAVANAVNYAQVYNAATSGRPALRFTGSDTNVSGDIYAKGTGTVYFRDSSFNDVFHVAGSGAVQAATLDIANADTTVTRLSAGQLAVEGNPLGTKVSVPASASAAGVVGQWACDSSYHYVCIADNTWVRSAAATW